MVEATSDRNEHMVLKHVSNQSGNKNDDRKKPLKIFNQNIRGLKEKVNELMISFLNEEPSVICLTEHHLMDCEMDASHIPKYKLGASYCRKK
jgi:hypothetical protein